MEARHKTNKTGIEVEVEVEIKKAIKPKGRKTKIIKRINLRTGKIKKNRKNRIAEKTLRNIIQKKPLFKAIWMRKPMKNSKSNN